MRRFFAPAPLLLGGLLLSGCAPQMDEHIIAEHDAALTGLKGKSVSIAIDPFKPGDPTAIPLYIETLQTKFVQQGYVISDDGKKADLVVMGNYHIQFRPGVKAPSGRTAYDLTLSLVVFDDRHPTKGPVLYKGMVVLTGDCPSMPAVYPYLADALFKDWPGPSGGLHEMKLPMPGFRCRG